MMRKSETWKQKSRNSKTNARHSKTRSPKQRRRTRKHNWPGKRAQTAAYLQSQISTLFQQYQDEVRQNVNERVNEIFQDIIAKNYYAKISDDYTLQILKDVGETSEIPVAQSSGGNDRWPASPSSQL